MTPDLFDILTRIQVYVEGVKLGLSNRFNVFLRKLADEITKELGKVRRDRLDQLTKAELIALVKRLNRMQAEAYSFELRFIVDQLRMFVDADAKMHKRMIASFYLDEQCDDLAANEYFQHLRKVRLTDTPLFGWAAIDGNDFSSLWSRISNAPIPGNGMQVDSFLSSFSTSAQSSVANLVNMGYANSWTPDETLQQIVGTQGAAFRDGCFNTITNQARTVIDTVIAHGAALTAAAIASAVANEYEWVSVMDAHTSAICANRNGQRYQYGQGPQPPAHLNCRSHTIPVTENGDIPHISYYNWARGQSESFLLDVYSAEVAKSLIDGMARSADFSAYRATKPLSLSQFATRDQFILST